MVRDESVNGGYVYEAEEGKKGMKGMERIGQYCPEESIVHTVAQRRRLIIQIP